MHMRNRGFTLVELMIVLALIGILSLVGAPMLLDTIPQYRVDNAQKILTAEFQQARQRAVARNTTHRVTFDEANQKVFFDDLVLDPQTRAITGTQRVKELVFGSGGMDFPGVRLGRNSTAPVPDSPNAAQTGAAAFGPNADPEILFKSNGMAEETGEVFVMPVADYGKAKNDRIRCVQVFRSGMVRKWRYDGAAWEEQK